MNIKYKKNIILTMLVLSNLSGLMHAGLLDGKLTHNFTQQDISEMGEELRNSIPVLGKEMQEAANIFAKKLSDHAPELAQQVKKSCNEINKTVKVIANPLKTLPLSGVGVASAVAGFALLYKSLDAYCAFEIENFDDALCSRQKIERAIAFKRGLSGLALIVAGLATIIKSDAIVDRWA